MMDRYLKEKIQELHRVLTIIKLTYPNLIVMCKIDDPSQASLDLEVEE